MKKEDTRNPAANYNKVVTADLPGVMPQFDWDGYLAEAGIAEADGLILYMTDYMRALDDIIVDTDLDTWRTYSTSRTSSSSARPCPAPRNSASRGAVQLIRLTAVSAKSWARFTSRTIFHRRPKSAC